MKVFLYVLFIRDIAALDLVTLNGTEIAPEYGIFEEEIISPNLNGSENLPYIPTNGNFTKNATEISTPVYTETIHNNDTENAPDRVRKISYCLRQWIWTLLDQLLNITDQNQYIKFFFEIRH